MRELQSLGLRRYLPDMREPVLKGFIQILYRVSVQMYEPSDIDNRGIPPLITTLYTTMSPILFIFGPKVAPMELLKNPKKF